MYKITIEKITTETVMKEGEYTTIDVRPYTEEETENMSQQYHNRNEDLPMKNVKGYAPDHEVTKTNEATIFEQTVEDLDLAAVIAVINGLSAPEDYEGEED